MRHHLEPVQRPAFGILISFTLMRTQTLMQETNLQELTPMYAKLIARYSLLAVIVLLCVNL